MFVGYECGQQCSAFTSQEVSFHHPRDVAMITQARHVVLTLHGDKHARQNL